MYSGVWDLPLACGPTYLPGAILLMVMDSPLSEVDSPHIGVGAHEGPPPPCWNGITLILYCGFMREEILSCPEENVLLWCPLTSGSDTSFCSLFQDDSLSLEGRHGPFVAGHSTVSALGPVMSFCVKHHPLFTEISDEVWKLHYSGFRTSLSPGSSVISRAIGRKGTFHMPGP